MRSRASLFAAAALLLAALPSSGATFVALDSQQLVGGADAIVQGRVIELQSFWDEGGRIIVTEATVRVTEAILGSPESVVKVQTPGGRVGSFRVEAEGFPKYRLGSEVILFLEPANDAGVRRTRGFKQGQFEVVTRLDGVTLAVPALDANTRLFTPSGARVPAPRSVEISEFKANIERIAERAGRPVR